ncbi:MAG TPA: PHB depolymerase family esterase [Luteimonas sp.]|nr:PHB depolymerase family esterase [Luteimonas sp.]
MPRDSTPPIDMAEATRLTREGRLDEAMAVLRGGAPLPAKVPAGAAASARPAIDAFESLQRKLGKGVRPPAGAAGRRPAPRAAVPAGAQIQRLNHACSEGQRAYDLYVPGGAGTAAPRPLLVMLHGCTQSADDFTRGTRMNEQAEARGVLVAWPEQPSSANPSRCWNWFNAADQQRDHGEPAVLAGIARAVMAAHAVDPRRVFVAGLSAGAATAATLGQLYPDLFAAVGVHSGLAAGAARDMTSAFGAMRGAAPGSPGRLPVRTIVFHGDADGTVDPANATQVLAQAAAGVALLAEVESGQTQAGVAYTRTRSRDGHGRIALEYWNVQRMGHAWSGGSADGSYTAPDGPDASAAMLDFFLG